MRLFVDNLTNVDFSYLDAKRGLVGETWLASIELAGELDDQGMVCDFGIVKKTVRHWLDTFIDHCLLAPLDTDALVHTLDKKNDQRRHLLKWQSDRGLIECEAPEQAITLINSQQIEPTVVAHWCEHKLYDVLPDSVINIKLTFEPECIQDYFYHYSHGLKKHAGNCQRIAHGHRSTLNIYKNGHRDSELEKAWCDQWRDIYIGTLSDIVDEDDTSIYFGYQSMQGDFSLKLPKACCYNINTDTTVEHIANHIYQLLAAEDTENEYVVKAFEGMGKGAIAGY